MSITVDDFIESLKSQYGEDFAPDSEKDWYEYNCRKDSDSPMMVGADGYVTSLYWDEYHENKKQIDRFVNELESTASDLIEKIESRELDEEDDDVYQDETYTRVLLNNYCLLASGNKYAGKAKFDTFLGPV